MSDDNGIGMLALGVLIGAVIGAVFALLFAPQSGEETRAMIKDKSIELRDKAQETTEQARARTDEVVTQMKEQGKSAMKAVTGDKTSKPQASTAA